MRCCKDKGQYFGSHGTEVMDKAYPAVVAVEQEGVVSRVEDEAEDGSHDVDGDRLLLGALHVEDEMLYAVVGQERLVLGREVLLHEGSRGLLAPYTCTADLDPGQHEEDDSHNCLQSQPLVERVVLSLWKATPVDTRQDFTEVERSAILTETIELV